MSANGCPCRAAAMQTPHLQAASTLGINKYDNPYL